MLYGEMTNKKGILALLENHFPKLKAPLKLFLKESPYHPAPS